MSTKKTTRYKIWPGESHLFLPLALFAAAFIPLVEKWRLPLMAATVIFGITGTCIAVLSLQKQMAEIRARLDEDEGDQDK